MTKQTSEQNLDEELINVEPKLLNVMCIQLPAKDPYTTAKWYSEIFDLKWDKSFAPLVPNADMVVLRAPGLSFFFMRSDDNLKIDYNTDGNNHSIFLFQVRDIKEIHQRMIDKGVKIATVKDRDGCGDEISFFDPDGRKVDINNFGYK